MFRSILMSPTSFTLFRGFHHHRSTSTCTDATTTTNITIDGLPQALPDFFDFENGSLSFEFSTVFSESFDSMMMADGNNKEKKKQKVEAAGNFSKSDGDDDETTTAAKGETGDNNESKADGKTTSSKGDDATAAGSISMDLESSNVTNQGGGGDDDAYGFVAATANENEEDDAQKSDDDDEDDDDDDDHAAGHKKRDDIKIEEDVFWERKLTECLLTKLQAIIITREDEQQQNDRRFSVEQEVWLGRIREVLGEWSDSSSADDDTPPREIQERVDLLVFHRKKKKNQEQESQEQQPPSKKIPLGMVAFALLDESDPSCTGTKEETCKKLEHKFWETYHHTTQSYLQTLRQSSSDNNWIWKNTFLLGILVATRDCTTIGRLAVFACEPKGTNDWRMALLWRSQCESMEDISKAFGSFLNAVNYLATDGEKLADNKEAGITWKYLGPHCKLVKIKEKKYVLRSYDNRLWPSSRSPRVYKKWPKLRDTMIHLFLIHDDAADPSNTLDFATVVDKRSQSFDKSMLFAKWNNGKGGKVEVIAVPYEEGTHECTSVIQLLSLILYMKAMHEDGYVHGDVRGLNIVFLPVPDHLNVSDFLPTSDNQLEFSDEVNAKIRKIINDVQGTTNKDRFNNGLTEVFNDLPFAITPGMFDYARLIDFDFGGHVEQDKPIYPPGYEAALRDGLRHDGKAGHAIIPIHDVWATSHVLSLHELMIDARDVFADHFWFSLKLSQNTLPEQELFASKLLRLVPKHAIVATTIYKEYLKSIDPDVTETVKGGKTKEE